MGVSGYVPSRSFLVCGLQPPERHRGGREIKGGEREREREREKGSGGERKREREGEGNIGMCGRRDEKEKENTLKMGKT